MSAPPNFNRRRGCIALWVTILLVLAAIAFIGFNGEPLNRAESIIPTLGRN